ncbi:MAG: hypothetical protein SGPRY_009476, partial [Prymnesium sp.]
AWRRTLSSMLQRNLPKKRGQCLLRCPPDLYYTCRRQKKSRGLAGVKEEALEESEEAVPGMEEEEMAAAVVEKEWAIRAVSQGARVAEETQAVQGEMEEVLVREGGMVEASSTWCAQRACWSRARRL